MLIALVGIVSLVLVYFFIKPLADTRANRVKLLKWFLVLIPVSILFYGIITYLTIYDKPESFRAAIEILEHNEDIMSKIGSYDSYSYYEKDLPTDSDNPASFKLSMKGSLATLYITGSVTKDQNGKWQIITVKQDSIIKKQ